MMETTQSHLDQSPAMDADVASEQSFALASEESNFSEPNTKKTWFSKNLYYILGGLVVVAALAIILPLSLGGKKAVKADGETSDTQISENAADKIDGENIADRPDQETVIKANDTKEGEDSNKVDEPGFLTRNWNKLLLGAGFVITIGLGVGGYLAYTHYYPAVEEEASYPEGCTLENYELAVSEPSPEGLRTLSDEQVKADPKLRHPDL